MPHPPVDLTVIGGGPVGLFGAFYAGMRGMSVRIVDSLPELGGQLTALYPEKHVYDMPGFPEVLAKDLARGMADQAARFHPALVLGETAQTLVRDGEGWVVRTASGLTLPTRTLMIAAGAGAFSPTKLGVEQEGSYVGKGIHYGVRSLGDFAGKRVLVVGGGDSAFDWAIALHEVAAEVRLVHRRDVFKAHDHTVRLAKDRGIELLLWKAVSALHGGDSLTAVTLQDTQTKETMLVEAQSVVVNIGYKSSLGPIKDWGLEIEKGQVKVDHLLRTNLPGVFAVGDVCAYEGKLKLIATGVGEAATAVCVAKTMLDPTAKLFPWHSSDMEV